MYTKEHMFTCSTVQWEQDPLWREIRPGGQKLFLILSKQWSQLWNMIVHCLVSPCLWYMTHGQVAPTNIYLSHFITGDLNIWVYISGNRKQLSQIKVNFKYSSTQDRGFLYTCDIFLIGSLLMFPLSHLCVSTLFLDSDLYERCPHTREWPVLLCWVCQSQSQRIR